MSADLTQLRAHVGVLYDANSFDSAAFLASKLVALSKSQASDVFLLAKIHFANAKPMSAIQLIEQHKLCSFIHDKQYLAFCLLASQANAAANRIEDVLKISDPIFQANKRGRGGMGGGGARMNDSLMMMDEEDDSILASTSADLIADSLQIFGRENATLLSLICLERGKAYEFLDNRDKCLHWLKQSLLFDCRVMESLERIVSLRLSFREEQDLLRELERADCFVTTAPYLKTVYHGMLNMHGINSQGMDTAPSLAEEKQSGDADLLALRAETKYVQRDASAALELTSFVLKHVAVPPTSSRCSLVHIASLVELGKVSDLFYFAHNQVAEHPKAALSWYAVGAYYYAAKKFDLSRRFFAKASQLDANMLEAFIGCAHAHAMNEESDRAIAIYRAAARLFPFSHVPLLGTAMEYLRTNNAALAQQFGEVAKNLCEVDPAVYNELGVISYRMGDFPEACVWFSEALARVQALLRQQTFSSVTLETVTFNYAHALRRAGALKEALVNFKAALRLCPKSAAGHAALGLTHHLNNDPERAIESYHVALGLRPNDTLVAELMEFALVDMYSNSSIQL